MIEGVSLHPLKQISVPNGDLWHAFKATDEGFVGLVKLTLLRSNLMLSKVGSVIIGMCLTLW